MFVIVFLKNILSAYSFFSTLPFLSAHPCFIRHICLILFYCQQGKLRLSGIGCNLCICFSCFLLTKCPTAPTLSGLFHVFIAPAHQHAGLWRPHCPLPISTTLGDPQLSLSWHNHPTALFFGSFYLPGQSSLWAILGETNILCIFVSSKSGA